MSMLGASRSREVERDRSLVTNSRCPSSALAPDRLPGDAPPPGTRDFRGSGSVRRWLGSVSAAAARSSGRGSVACRTIRATPRPSPAPGDGDGAPPAAATPPDTLPSLVSEGLASTAVATKPAPTEVPVPLAPAPVSAAPPLGGSATPAPITAPSKSPQAADDAMPMPLPLPGAVAGFATASVDCASAGCGGVWPPAASSCWMRVPSGPLDWLARLGLKPPTRVEPHGTPGLEPACAMGNAGGTAASPCQGL